MTGRVLRAVGAATLTAGLALGAAAPALAAPAHEAANRTVFVTDALSLSTYAWRVGNGPWATGRVDVWGNGRFTAPLGQVTFHALHARCNGILATSGGGDIAC